MNPGPQPGPLQQREAKEAPDSLKLASGNNCSLVVSSRAAVVRDARFLLNLVSDGKAFCLLGTSLFLSKYKYLERENTSSLPKIMPSIFETAVYLKKEVEVKSNLAEGSLSGFHSNHGSLQAGVKGW